jgi:hypothetical protein
MSNALRVELGNAIISFSQPESISRATDEIITPRVATKITYQYTVFCYHPIWTDFSDAKPV